MTDREKLLQEIQHSPEALVKEVLDFLLFARNRNYLHSAEAKATSRLIDQDDPSKWITSLEVGEQIDEPDLNIWLEKKGYQKTSDITAQHQELTLNDLISTIPDNFQYPDDVIEFTEFVDQELIARGIPEDDMVLGLRSPCIRELVAAKKLTRRSHPNRS